MVIEELGHNEMEQCPQLSHRVLNRSSSQKQSISSLELQKYFPASTQVILDGLGLVQNHIIPLNLHEFGLVLGVVDY